MLNSTVYTCTEQTGKVVNGTVLSTGAAKINTNQKVLTGALKYPFLGGK